MLPNLGTIMFPEMQYGSLIISTVTTAIMLVSCLFPSKRPGIIGYLCLTAGVVGPYFYLFYGVYNILIYIPVLVLLHLTARQQKRESKSNRNLQIGVCFIYLGYLLSVAVLAGAIASVILDRLKIGNYWDPSMGTEGEEFPKILFDMAQKASLFTYYSIWGFIAINLVLTPIFYNSFKDTTYKRYSLILFNLLTIIAMIAGTILPYILRPDLGFDDDAKFARPKAMAFVSIFLLDLPNALAIVTWFFAHGGKSDRPQIIPLHGEADADTTSSNTSIIPHQKHSV
ncbi:hypothetical protein MBANPS3_003337 [Mucor bainieri]